MSCKEEIRRKVWGTELAISQEYLREVLELEEALELSPVEITMDRQTDTARIVKFVAWWKAPGMPEEEKSFFLKVPPRDKKTEAFDEGNIRETKFYANLPKGLDLPLARCLDAAYSEDEKDFLLLLEDVSGEYFDASQVDLEEESLWMKAAESLARFHGTFWGGKNLETLDKKLEDKETLEERIRNMERCVAKFLPRVEYFYSQRILEIYPKALEDAIAFERRRTKQRETMENCTLVNGDSHIFNFMIPKPWTHKKLPLIIDLQFWGAGLGITDVANLTRVSFPYAGDERWHFKILKHYHDCLRKQGILTYSWEDCLRDYCMMVSSTVLFPAYNYDGGIDFQMWGKGVLETTESYLMAKRLEKYLWAK